MPWWWYGSLRHGAPHLIPKFDDYEILFHASRAGKFLCPVWQVTLVEGKTMKDHPPRWVTKVTCCIWSKIRRVGPFTQTVTGAQKHGLPSFKGLSAAQFFIKTSWFTSWFIAALAKLPSSKALWESSITQSWVAVGWWTTTGIRTRNVVNQTSCI